MPPSLPALHVTQGQQQQSRTLIRRRCRRERPAVRSSAQEAVEGARRRRPAPVDAEDEGRAQIDVTLPGEGRGRRTTHRMRGGETGRDLINESGK